MSVTAEIKERLDIVEVISAYVSLKKAGRSYKGLCPFHNEKTPSFVVFPENQSWHCFGACATGGDVISFVMKRENLDFGEALERLAARAGVQLQPRAEQRSADEQHLDRLRQIISDAATYFNYLLNRAGEAAIARDYLERRGLLPATWEAWQLGYSLDSWDALKDRLTSKGYTLEELVEAGLVIQRDDGSGFYDRFRGRLMIPIRDVQGRTIGLGARLLREEATRPQPKYINSPQTPLFDKSSVLYGLDVARKAIRDANLAVIVEGYMDVLMSHQVGVSNVVAGMGTALTEAQMRLVKRYSSNLTLALDPDVAGDHAVLRGLEAARQTLEREWQPVLGVTGLVRQESRLKAQLRIATLPAGLDPDELARQDVAAWQRVIAEARPIVDYYLALVGREEDLTSARGKANAVGRLAPLIHEIASPVERNHYIQALARLVQTDERLVDEQVKALGRAAISDQRPAATDQRPTTGDRGPTNDQRPTTESKLVPNDTRRSSFVVRPSSNLEDHLLGCLLLRPDLLTRLDAEMIEQQTPPLVDEDFGDAENRAILSALQAASLTVESWAVEDALMLVGEALADRWGTVLAQMQRNPMLADERQLKDLGDSLLRLRERNLRQQINQLKFLAQESDQGGERDQARQYNELKAAHIAQIAHLQKLLYARSMAGALARTSGQK